jgi:hypothetical protein
MNRKRGFTDRRIVVSLAATCSLAAGPAFADGFQTNDFITYSQVAWGQD